MSTTAAPIAAPAGASRTPLRRCAVCRGRAVKSELVRALRTASGELRFDAAGVGEGRSAWFHRRSDCAGLAASEPRHLARALRAGPTPELLAAIADWASAELTSERNAHAAGVEEDAG